MNHIHRITGERDELQRQLAKVRNALNEIEHYLTSSKFTAPDSDYVHVRTDILPKIAKVRFMAI
jgi:hypothetical protein